MPGQDISSVAKYTEARKWAVQFILQFIVEHNDFKWSSMDQLMEELAWKEVESLSDIF